MSTRCYTVLVAITHDEDEETPGTDTLAEIIKQGVMDGLPFTWLDNVIVSAAVRAEGEPPLPLDEFKPMHEERAATQ